MLTKRIPFRLIMGFAQQKQEQDMKKMKEEFKVMVDELSRKDSFTLKDFKKDIFKQGQKSKSFIRRMFTEAQPEELQLEKMKKILNGFKEEELLGLEEISGEVKSEISHVTQTEVKDINDLIAAYKYQNMLHKYLKGRRERGEYIPQTQEELSNMLKTDRPINAKEHKYNQKRKFSTKERKWIR